MDWIGNGKGKEGLWSTSSRVVGIVMVILQWLGCDAWVLTWATTTSTTTHQIETLTQTQTWILITHWEIRWFLFSPYAYIISHFLYSWYHQQSSTPFTTKQKRTKSCEDFLPSAIHTYIRGFFHKIQWRFTIPLRIHFPKAKHRNYRLLLRHRESS